MSKNGVDACKSAQCCCKLIMKRPEKPAAVSVVKPRIAGNLKRAKNPEMSLCDFLKSHSALELMKVLQGNCTEAKDPEDKQRGPVRTVASPAPIHRTSQQPPSTECGAKNPQQHHQDIKQSPPQPTASFQEDRFRSQIIINIGTMMSERVCKRDSCQQTDPEVQNSVCPPAEKPTSVCPPVERPKSICPPAKKPTSVCPPVERPKSICPPAEKPTSVCPPVERPKSICPPAEKPTTACPPVERPKSICPPAEKPTTACPPAKRPTSICPPAKKLSTVCQQAERPIAAIPPKVCPHGIKSTPMARDSSSRHQSNAPSAVPSTEQKPCLDSEIKWTMNCCCTCHSD